MASESQPGPKKEVIAKEMIDQLALLSQAMDEYFEMPSMTMRDADTGSLYPEAAAPYQNGGVAEKPGIDYRSYRADKIFR
jgi:hypothetical protein